MIQSLHLQNFKNFRDAELTLGNLTLLVGTNASGKSNLRDAFRFLHGISRGYTLAEIIGEKWIEGGSQVWKGIRGGTREAAYRGDAVSRCRYRSRPAQGAASTRSKWRLEPTASRPALFESRSASARRSNFKYRSPPILWSSCTNGSATFNCSTAMTTLPFDWGDSLRVSLSYPRSSRATTLTLKQNPPRNVSWMCWPRCAFLDLAPDAMRMPSLPGQDILGDRGENLSSVLQSICENDRSKAAILEWIRELTPLDVTDFEFVSDQTGRVLVTLVESGGIRLRPIVPRTERSAS